MSIYEFSPHRSLSLLCATKVLGEFVAGIDLDEKPMEGWEQHLIQKEA